MSFLGKLVWERIFSLHLQGSCLEGLNSIPLSNLTIPLVHWPIGFPSHAINTQILIYKTTTRLYVAIDDLLLIGLCGQTFFVWTYFLFIINHGVKSANKNRWVKKKILGETPWFMSYYHNVQLKKKLAWLIMQTTKKSAQIWILWINVFWDEQKTRQRDTYKWQ